MKGLSRLCAPAVLWMVALTAAAGPVERINAIKRDPSFIYGEATKATTDLAYDAALNVLQSNIQRWCEDNGDKKAGNTVRNMSFLADTIHAVRGGYQRVFAYVAAEKIRETLHKDREMVESARKGAASPILAPVTAQMASMTAGKALRHLLEKRFYNDFAKQVVEDTKAGVLDKASRDITTRPANSYLAVFNRAQKGFPLIHLLVPGNGPRQDIMTGQVADPDIFLHHSDTYRLLWFVTNDKNNEE